MENVDIQVEEIKNFENGLFNIIEDIELERDKLLSSALTSITKDSDEKEALSHIKKFTSYKPTEDEILKHLGEIFKVISLEYKEVNTTLMEYIQETCVSEEFQEKFMEQLMNTFIDKTKSLFEVLFESIFSSIGEIFSEDEKVNEECEDDFEDEEDILQLYNANDDIIKDTVTESVIDKSLIINNPDIIAKFPGENYELGLFFQQNLMYPLDAQKDGAQGRVVCRFIVNEDGTICNIEILRGVYKSLDEEAIRVIKLMPKWEPAKYEDKPVRSSYILPIDFRMN